MMSRSICILRTSRLRSWLLYCNEYDLPMCSTFLTAERDSLTTGGQEPDSDRSLIHQCD